MSKLIKLVEKDSLTLNSQKIKDILKNVRTENNLEDILNDSIINNIVKVYIASIFNSKVYINVRNFVSDLFEDKTIFEKIKYPIERCVTDMEAHFKLYGIFFDRDLDEEDRDELLIYIERDVNKVNKIKKECNVETIHYLDYISRHK